MSWSVASLDWLKECCGFRDWDAPSVCIGAIWTNQNRAIRGKDESRESADEQIQLEEGVKAKWNPWAGFGRCGIVKEALISAAYAPKGCNNGRSVFVNNATSISILSFSMCTLFLHSVHNKLNSSQKWSITSNLTFNDTNQLWLHDVNNAPHCQPIDHRMSYPSISI